MQKNAAIVDKMELVIYTYFDWRDVGMAKSKETYLKVAETFKKKADKEWAMAKSGDGGHHYDNAKRGYATAEKARKKADEM